ncbi:MAG: glycosyltransferase family 2 protein [Solirubrobacterales bacterium]
MSVFDIRDFDAPIAVRTFDLADDVGEGLTLGENAQGERYTAAYVVATDGGRPAGTLTFEAEPDGRVSADALRAGLESLRGADRDASPAAPATERPLVSIVVAVVDGGRRAARCVDAILAGSYDHVELVVVNNRPQNGGVTLDPASAAAGDPRVRFVDEPISGLAHARNRGGAVASGEIVAFTDDDVVPDPDWVARIVDAFAANPGTSCVTGLILPLALETDAQTLLERYAGFSKGVERQVFSKALNGHEPMFPYAAGRFGSGANLAMTASAMRELGGFDDALGTGTPALGGEDIDLFIRLLLDGRQLVYEPAAMVWHEHPSEVKTLQRQVFCYGAGLVATITKQLLHGTQRLHLLRQLPPGLWHAIAPDSEKNARKGYEFPRALSLRELGGMAYGPLAYLRSHRRERKLARSGVTTALTAEPTIVALMPDFTPAYVRELDLGRPIEALTAPPRPDGGEYPRARLVVRLHRAPVGIVELPLQDGAATEQAVVDAINGSLSELIARHFQQDGLPAEPLTTAGYPFDGEPPCLAMPATGEADPFVSVVVCTRDRAKSLARALRSILAVEYENFEVVLVDNAPATAATRSVVDEFADPRVRYVLEPIAGLSRARNRGLSEVRGEIVAFTDDDVEVDSYWLRGLLHGFAHTEKVGCVTGVIPTTALENESQQYFDDLVSWSEGFERRSFDLHENRDENALYPYSAGMFGAGANFAMKMAAARDIGMFDEALGAGAPTRGGEDLDYFARMVLGGWSLVYEPLALVWHYHRADNESLKTQIWGYGTGATAYGIKTALSLRHGPQIAWLLVKYVLRRARKDEALGEIDLGYGELREIQVRGLYAGPFLYFKGRWAARKNPKIRLPRA